ncbi:MAG: hypothetical protein KJZ77_12995 [Anaerolineales bacterium]|nr:hypothetical protein [Anaerolineales bacterium]
MDIKKFFSYESAKIYTTAASVAFGLLLGPILEKIIDPLFDVPTKALLTGFVFLAFIVLIALTAVSILNNHHNEQMNRYETKLSEIGENIKLTNSFETVGISGANLNLPKELRDGFWEGSRSEIKILQTYIASLQQLSPSIFSAVKNGAKFKLLLLDPDGVMIRKRMKDVGLPNNSHAHKDAMERLKLLIRKNNPSPELFEVRVYDQIPPMAIYKADKRMCIGFFWHGQHSPTGPHIFLNDCASPLGKAAENTFDIIWQSAKVLDIQS